MAYSPRLASFVYKVSWDVITKYKDDKENASALADIVSGLAEFRRNGIITDAQLDSLSDYLGVHVEVPDAPNTYEDNLAAVQQGVDMQGNAIAELSEVTSLNSEGQQVIADALAELSEIVSNLVPTE